MPRDQQYNPSADPCGNKIKHVIKARCGPPKFLQLFGFIPDHTIGRVGEFIQ